MVAVDHSAAQFRTNLIELITEMRHLVSTVFVTGDDFINRIYNDSNIILLCCTPDQLRRQLIHRNRLATQIPYIDIRQIARLPPHCRINILKTMQTTLPFVQLKLSH